MGQSTDAILCWGIHIDEYGVPWEDKAEELGQDDPYSDEAIACVIADQKLSRGGVVKTLKDHHIELVTHCHHEGPMYILALEGTVKTAHRGYPQTINFEALSQIFDAKMLLKFQEAVVKLGLGIDDNTKGRWILCSYWH